ncbi:hypothetical protein Micbo1qcDRAFT_172356 [Microdochium bolleyi]|uniref:Uncharacterized protein n=1 Tax=Microdochium bolleyi TaxID=196109 RepID=A0A136JFZ7_9PEZI|nr:hypothetical protein Micbo1qcDRAFT_172356 [Microdochium bolleyi]
MLITLKSADAGSYGALLVSCITLQESGFVTLSSAAARLQLHLPRRGACSQCSELSMTTLAARVESIKASPVPRKNTRRNGSDYSSFTLTIRRWQPLRVRALPNPGDLLDPSPEIGISERQKDRQYDCLHG